MNHSSLHHNATFSRRQLLTRAALLASPALVLPITSLGAAEPELKIGAPAPPLVLHTLDGVEIDTRQMRGQVVLAAFWATWCAPCQDEMPLLSAFALQHAHQGLRVIGFSLDSPDQLPKVRQVANRLSFPVGLLPQARVPGYGRIWRLPVSFVIDRAGRLAHNGWDDDGRPWTQAQLESVVQPLLISNH